MPPTIPDDVEINNKLLIELIKKKPLLYDRHFPGYSNLEQKKNAWREIGSVLFPDHWAIWDSASKHAAVTGMQQRWGNLRTCFARCWKKYHKRKRQGHHEDPVSYRYFERLQFLTKHMNLQYDTKMENLSADSEDLHSDGDNREDLIEEYEEQYLEDSFQEEEYLDTEEPEKKKIKKEIHSITDPLNSTSSNRAVNGLNFVLDNMETATDQDINFVMSLVPMFRGLPLSKKLQVQIDILNLFRKITDN